MVNHGYSLRSRKRKLETEAATPDAASVSSALQIAAALQGALDRELLRGPKQRHSQPPSTVLHFARELLDAEAALEKAAARSQPADCSAADASAVTAADTDHADADDAAGASSDRIVFYWDEPDEPQQDEQLAALQVRVRKSACCTPATVQSLLQRVPCVHA